MQTPYKDTPVFACTQVVAKIEDFLSKLQPEDRLILLDLLANRVLSMYLSQDIITASAMIDEAYSYVHSDDLFKQDVF